MSLVIESQHFRAVTGSLCPDLKVPYLSVWSPSFLSYLGPFGVLVVILHPGRHSLFSSPEPKAHR